VKSFGTDNAVHITSTGIQVHGGMGFIEETGAAQYLRDARILPIYEGTNGIQALDLMFRKTFRDQGAAVKAYIKSLETNADETLKAYTEKLASAVDHILTLPQEKAAFIAHSYCLAFGLIAGGVKLYQLSNAAEGHNDNEFAKAKSESYVFYKDHILPRAKACIESILAV
jgi:hypothetical protein